MASETVEVALAEGSEALAALVTNAGARSGSEWAEVLLVDARADQRCVADAEAVAATARQALLAIVSDQSGAAAAYDAGATHVCIRPLHAPGDFAARDAMLATMADL